MVRRDRHILGWGVVLWSTTILSATAQPEDDASLTAQEVCAWVKDRLPRSVYYELLLDGAEPGNLARHLIVYDLATNSYVNVGNGEEVFVRRDGEEFWARPTRDALLRSREIAPGDEDPSPPYLGSELPVLYARWVVDHPAYVQAAEARPGGGYRVVCKFPRRMGGVPEFDWVIDFDDEGAVVSSGSPGAALTRPASFVYAEEFPRNWMVLSDEFLAWNWTVERRDVRELAPAGAFADRRIARMAMEADTSTKSWSREKVDAARGADGLEAIGLDPVWQRAIRRAKGEAHPWRVALVLGGLLLLVLSGVGWWRRRS